MYNNKTELNKIVVQAATCHCFVYNFLNKIVTALYTVVTALYTIIN
jgi:hypothetical protein